MLNPERKIIESQLKLLNEILDPSKPRLTHLNKHDPIFIKDIQKYQLAVEIYTRILNIQNELLDRLYEIPESIKGDWSDIGNAID
mgnify:CR=1 FL=1|jgi:hypothetical protein|tara:strand:+ start:1062 stop:1316 length:255 start_codon:yes stop_codon:yes gene_type:complete